MTTRKYLIPLLAKWYTNLTIWEKLLYPLITIIFYLISTLFLVGLYWVKTDMGYNMLTNGGWHSFAQCLMKEAQKAQIAPRERL